MSTFQKLWRRALILSGILHIFIFAGVLIQGFLDLLSPLIFVDYLYAALYITIGAFAVIIFGGDLKILFDPKRSPKKMKRWQRDLPKIIIASILFVILFIFRFQLSGILLFLGFEIGRFFIRVATSAYQTLFDFNLNEVKFYLFAWVFQWHFLFAVTGLAEAVGKRVFLMMRRIL